MFGTDYIIVESFYFGQIQEDVNKQIQKGYIPLGNVNYQQGKYIQAMIHRNLQEKINYSMG